MAGFVKLHADMLDSTIWRAEDDKTRIVWITMLCKADRLGELSCSLPGLADSAKVSLDDCIKAIERLKSPDKYSRTKDFEGRRIEEIDGGWRILNYMKYRERGRYLDRLEYHATKQAEYRARSKKAGISLNFETGQFEGIEPQDVEQWKQAYPAVDIELAIKQAAAWIKANPTKRKNNYKRFFVNWFKRTQDQGGNKREANNKPNGTQRTTEEIAKEAVEAFERSPYAKQ